MPRERQDALLQEREIRRYLEQSRISEKNLSRLRTLARSKNVRIAELAVVALEVASVAPYRWRRIGTLARERFDVLKRMERTGLV